MKLTIKRDWMSNLDYHGLSASAKLTLWECLGACSEMVPKTSKELAFMLHGNHAEYLANLKDLEASGFAVRDERDRWHIVFGDDIKVDTDAERQRKSRASKKVSVAVSVVSGESDEEVNIALPVQVVRDPVPYQDVVDLYHSNCPKMPKVFKIEKTRQRLIKSMWVDMKKLYGPESTKDDILEGFSDYFKDCGNDAWLCGEANKRGAHENWIASIDFLLNPKQFLKNNERFAHRAK